ncbi:TPA: hypothetical protein HL449_09295 [Escherichia coli]|uniref:Uncharacterized protein n=1 Tax=Escherichia coli TaxID=562 RepID=A0A2L0MPU0_ECOLX|nr:hypothetical protein CU080_07695 [Escherichia coli]AYO73092.1 hypothetical protein EAS44_13700 [Escherichia coli DSM 30083 = JCM 1649 = ATCC 11775]EEY7560110.1 hypothetical protein [Escherichia coli O2]EFA8834835.1 hypothetical protein [Escherichia coli O1:H7]EFB2701408.1 hypothetical protein [Escherichia coli O157:H7]EFK14793.1 hypothetical protein HMPREF9541_02859 [Escherichia coli MS 116-1]EFU46217.1 hypothetical protein HMPREF9539_03244 [Escherichia coli MS 110-3]EFW7501895.1 hypothet
MRNHEEQQHETCCNTSAGIAEISPVPDAGDTPAHLSADSSGLPTVCHHFLTDSSFPSSRQSLVFVSYRPVLMCVFRVSAPA